VKNNKFGRLAGNRNTLTESKSSQHHLHNEAIMVRHSMLTNAQRRNLCKYKLDNPSVTQLQLVEYMAREHNVHITQGTVSNTLKRSKAVLENDGIDLNAKKVLLIDLPDVDKALMEWYRLNQDRISITGDRLKSKAADFMRICHPNLNPLKEVSSGWSNGWLQSFQKRCGFHDYSSRMAESSSGSSIHRLHSQQGLPTLQRMIDSYHPEDVFNMDETGLLFRLPPDASAMHSLQGPQRDINRISIVLCTNESGTEKMPLTIIGHTYTPQCFKRHGNSMEAYGIKWQANKKAWMTTSIFQEWLLAFDGKMAGRRVLLIIDDCPSQTITGLKLKNTNIQFLERNTTTTTSVVQPCEAGITKTFKAHYRKTLNEEMIAHHVNSRLSFKMDVADAILLSILAWDAVNTSTIQSCFRHCGLRTMEEGLGPSNRFEELNLLIREIQGKMTDLHLAQPIAMQDMLNLREESITHAIMTDEDLVACTQEYREDDIEEDLLLPSCPSHESSIKSLEVQIRYQESLEHWDGQIEFLLMLLKALRRTRARLEDARRQKRTAS
jgi:hypothetical protein